jgi:large subunit ribosomal protein L3
MKAILGQKLGMTQIFDDEARAIPVTVVKAGPVHVIQIKTMERDGYNAIQISFGEMKPGKANKPEAGHFAKAGVAPGAHLVEVKVEDPSEYQVGQEIKVAEVFEPGVRQKKHRAPGSIGACATPARVFKGMRMAGRMGGEKVTTLSLEVVGVDEERGLLLLGGSVPGPRGSIVLVREAVKARG